jgi:hypothetical protein
MTTDASSNISTQSSQMREKIGGEYLDISDFTHDSGNGEYVLKVQNNTTGDRALDVKISTFGNGHENIINGESIEITGTPNEVEFEWEYLPPRSEYYIGVNFQTTDTFTYVAPEDFKITSIDNPDSLTLTTEVNGSAYTLGDTISQYDEVTIARSGTGFIKLNSALV